MSKKKKKIREGGVYSRTDRVIHGIMFAILVFLCFCCLYPFLLILSSSFQSQNVIMENGYRVFAGEYTLETYKMIFTDMSTLLDSYAVTILSTVLYTGIGVLVTALCGYVLSRKDYKYRKILSVYILFTMLFHGGLPANYILITRWLNMKDTIWALVLPGCVGAYHILLFKGFFSTISTELIESAKLDGATERKIFGSIIVPMSKPAVATVCLMLVLSSWNEYFSSMLYTESQKLCKLQYLLMKLLNNIDFLNSPEYMEYMGARGLSAMDIPTYGARMAMCVLAAGPILLIFPFFQKYFVKGINLGGIKG